MNLFRAQDKVSYKGQDSVVEEAYSNTVTIRIIATGKTMRMSQQRLAHFIHD